MARIIAVANQKGGVGKTTTAINLAASVATRGYRVLLVDFDPQGNASSGVGHPRDKVELTIYDALVGNATLAEVIRPTDLPTLWVAPATTDLVGAEIELIGADRRERFLADCLATVAADYDYMVIDCPPSLGILTLNALIAAGEILIPVEPGYFPLIGIGLLQRTINDVAQINDLELLGVIPTLQDRTVESRETLEGLRQMFGDKVFPAIPSRVAVRNAHAAQTDIFAFATDAATRDAAEAFAGVVKEVARG